MTITDPETLRERLRRTATAARASADAADGDRAARNAVIWEAEASGWRQRQIAAATGLEQSTVAAILAKQAKASRG